MGTPATISTARFPVIHGPMRAAPLWHARIGRWVTGDGDGKSVSPYQYRPVTTFLVATLFPLGYQLIGGNGATM